jgi:ParB family chromosome partitioning protein
MSRPRVCAIAAMKKQAMAEAAEQRLAGTGWLPECLRTGAIIEPAAEQAA